MWIVVGLVLCGVEIFTPGGFFLLFFGLGALLVGALAATGLIPDLAAQILLFLAASVGGILVFRRALVARFGRGPAYLEVDSLVGAVAEALEDLAPGAIGKVELRGASWEARNSGGVPVSRGQRCTVERVDGLTLWVRIAADEFLSETRTPDPLPRETRRAEATPPEARSAESSTP